MKIFIKNKKVPAIPPLPFNGALFTDFQIKANIFNSFFGKQCTLVSNDSVFCSEFTYIMEKRIHITFSESNVITIKEPWM